MNQEAARVREAKIHISIMKSTHCVPIAKKNHARIRRPSTFTITQKRYIVMSPSFFTFQYHILCILSHAPSLKSCLPGCAGAGAPAGVLAQGLVSRAGRAGGRTEFWTGGLAVAAATEKAGAVPFTTADKRQKLVQASLCVGWNGLTYVVRHA